MKVPRHQNSFVRSRLPLTALQRQEKYGIYGTKPKRDTADESTVVPCGDNHNVCTNKVVPVEKETTRCEKTPIIDLSGAQWQCNKGRGFSKGHGSAARAVNKSERKRKNAVDKEIQEFLESVEKNAVRQPAPVVLQLATQISETMYNQPPQQQQQQCNDHAVEEYFLKLLPDALEQYFLELPWPMNKDLAISGDVDSLSEDSSMMSSEYLLPFSGSSDTSEDGSSIVGPPPSLPLQRISSEEDVFDYLYGDL